MRVVLVKYTLTGLKSYTYAPIKLELVEKTEVEFQEHIQVIVKTALAAHQAVVAIRAS
jgi:hypothetical protein